MTETLTRISELREARHKARKATAQMRKLAEGNRRYQAAGKVQNVDVDIVGDAYVDWYTEMYAEGVDGGGKLLQIESTDEAKAMQRALVFGEATLFDKQEANVQAW